MINPVTGGKTKQTSPTLTGTAEAGTGLVIKNSNNTEFCTVASVPANGIWSCKTANTYTDGTTLSLQAVSTDTAGNSSDVSDAIGFSIEADPFVPGVTPPPAHTNHATPSISGTGVPEAKILVSDGTNQCEATVQADQSWNCVLPELSSEKAYTFTVTQTVTQSDHSTETGQTSFSFTYDQTVTHLNLTNPVNSRFYQSTAVTKIAGTGAEAGATITVTEQGQTEPLCTTTAASPALANGAWECTLSAQLSAGPYQLTAQQKDLAGNDSATLPAAATPVTFTIDNSVEPPTLSTLTTGPTQNTQPAFNGTGETGAVVTVQTGNTTLCRATVVGTTWACDYGKDENKRQLSPAVAPLTHGLHTVTATQVDQAGNQSEAGGPVKIDVDLQKPVAPAITNPVKDNDYIATGLPLFTGTGEATAKVTVKNGDTTICEQVTVNDNNTWQCEVTSTLASGDHTITVTQTDLAGNTSDPATRAFKVDTYVPTPTLNIGTVTADNTLNISEASQNIVITGTVTGTKDKDYAQGEKVTINLGGTAYQGDISAVGQFDITLPGSTLATQNPAQITATYAHTGPSGLFNNPAATVTRPYTVATATPATPAITPFAGNTAKQQPELTGTAQPAAKLEVKDATGTTICTVTSVPATGNWSCSIANAYTNGTVLTLHAESTDPAGNPSAPSAPITLTIADAPFVPGVVAPAEYTNDNAPILKGTGIPGAAIMIGDGSTHGCNTTVDQTGAWECKLGPALETEQLYQITVTQTVIQPNGSIEAATSQVHFTYDKTVTHLAITRPSNDQHYQAANLPKIIGTGAENGAVLSLTTPSGEAFCTDFTNSLDAQGSWECTLSSSLSNGTYTVIANQVDRAGNSTTELPQTATPVSFVIDNTAPALPVVKTPALTATGDVGNAGDAGDGGDQAENQQGSSSQVNTSQPVFTGIGEPGATVTIYGQANPAPGTEPTPDTTPFELCSTVVTADNTWACTYGLNSKGESITGTDPGTAPAQGLVEDLPYNIQVAQTDQANNTSETLQVSLTGDYTQPEPVQFTKPVAQETLRFNSVLLAGTGEPGASLTVTANNDKEPVCQTTVLANTAWSCTAELPFGNYTVTAVQTDTAGNGSTPATRIFDIVKAAPYVPSVPGQQVPGYYVPTNDPHPNKPAPGNNNDPAGPSSWNGSNLRVVIDPLGPVATNRSTTVGGTVSNIPLGFAPGSVTAQAVIRVGGHVYQVPVAISGSTGRFALQLPGNVLAAAPSRSIEVTVTVTTPVGAAQAKNSVVYTLAGAPIPRKPASPNPRVTAVNGAPLPAGGNANSMQGRPVITGFGTPGARIKVLVDDQEACSTTVDADGSWECQLDAPLPPGSYEVTATEADALGQDVYAAGTGLDVYELAARTPLAESLWFWLWLLALASSAGMLLVARTQADGVPVPRHGRNLYSGHVYVTLSARKKTRRK